MFSQKCLKQENNTEAQKIANWVCMRWEEYHEFVSECQKKLKKKYLNKFSSQKPWLSKTP